MFKRKSEPPIILKDVNYHKVKEDLQTSRTAYQDLAVKSSILDFEVWLLKNTELLNSLSEYFGSYQEVQLINVSFAWTAPIDLLSSRPWKYPLATLSLCVVFAKQTFHLFSEVDINNLPENFIIKKFKYDCDRVIRMYQSEKAKCQVIINQFSNLNDFDLEKYTINESSVLVNSVDSNDELDKVREYYRILKDLFREEIPKRL